MDENSQYESGPDGLPPVTQMTPQSSPSAERAALGNARGEGAMFLWGSLGLAAAWWICASLGAVLFFNGEGQASLPTLLIIAGCIALALPGLVILLAGLLARAHARAAATNAVVLEAAARLLAPLETSGQEARIFADQMKRSAGDVDRSMAHALSSMKAMAGEISDERQRLETVSGTAAESASRLSERLATERKALETLAADIRNQTEVMSDAIPRQAEQMRDSARQAATDIAEADESLENRLADLKQASTSLTDRVAMLDEMSVDATKRSEALIFAVTRMEEKLDQSRKMVDQALRASEMVAASASTTGDRITDAVSSAMENARSASRDIQDDAREAAEKAAESLAALKKAGEDAAEAVRQARNDADALAALQFHQPNTAPDDQPAAPGPASRFEPESSSFHYSFAERSAPPSRDDADVFVDEQQPRPQPPRPQRPSASDQDLFEAGGDDEPAPADEPERQPESGYGEPETGTQGPVEADPVPLHQRWADRIPPYLKPVEGSEAVGLQADAQNGPEDEGGHRESEASAKSEAREYRSERWSDILADISTDDRPSLPREENAERIIQKLMDSGIRLTEIFRPRDKKKIATAARKGDGTRRNAVVDAASRQVQRVQKRLDTDSDLMLMAREFLMVEERDALTALDKTSHSSKNASARLTAFLLIDSAMG
jgi:methyl-accepting chemotaxis protein